jgi:hypothetical protein
MFRRPILILALLLAAGCSSPTASASPTPTPTPTPTPSPSPTKSPLPAGWSTVTRAADGFTISIPPTWRAIDMDPQTMTAAFKTMVEQNPSLAQTYSVEQMQALVQQGIKVMAFDFGNGGHTNLNVLEQALPTEMSASVFAQLAASQVEVQLKIAPPKVESAIVGSLDAQVIRYDLPLQTANGTFNASFSQYIAMRGKDAYIITFTSQSEDAVGNRPTFDQIAANFVLLP